MNKQLIALFITILLGLKSFTIDMEDLKSLASGNKNLQRNVPTTVPHVDLQRYMGYWYEIASIPTWFQMGCEKTFQNLSMNPDGTIKIDNGCSNKKGVQHEGYGKAFPDPKDTTHSNSKLKIVMPPFPGEGDYWIVRLDESYSYAVVSSPDYRHLWVFYRSPIMAEKMYQDIYNDLKKDGYHVDKLRKTIQ